MILRAALGRQILFSMAAVTLTTVLLAILGAYVLYGLIATFYPEQLNFDSWIPTGTDLLLYAITAFIALVVAGVGAIKLASRILFPISSLAESARRIADGDLSARALPGDKSLGETAHLVTDFNTMAERLQVMANNMATWNAVIAHELRTPLTVLRGGLQGIADGVFTPDEHRIKGLLLQAEALTRLADDLRVVTLADNNRLGLKIERLTISSEIRRVVESIGPSLIEANLTVRLTVFDIAIDADGMRIRQALLALLENARRYANPGLIEISTLVCGDQLLIRVEDEGPGLTPEFALRAFEPFSRPEASRSRNSGGSGLGLSVVRAVAEAHGGAVSYRRSTTLGGSAFELFLPISKTPATEHS